MLKEFDSKKLCEIIVCNRYLKIADLEASQAMEELSLRRQNGDDFDFEKFIEESFKDLPDLSFSLKDFNAVVRAANK